MKNDVADAMDAIDRLIGLSWHHMRGGFQHDSEEALRAADLVRSRLGVPRRKPFDVDDYRD